MVAGRGVVCINMASILPACFFVLPAPQGNRRTGVGRLLIEINESIEQLFRSPSWELGLPNIVNE